MVTLTILALMAGGGLACWPQLPAGLAPSEYHPLLITLVMTSFSHYFKMMAPAMFHCKNSLKCKLLSATMGGAVMAAGEMTSRGALRPQHIVGAMLLNWILAPFCNEDEEWDDKKYKKGD